MWDTALDLVTGSSCAACHRPGRVLCGDCARSLPVGGRPAWPSPVPPGLVAPFAAGEYDGALRALVNAHKERSAFALARPLGELLAYVVLDLLASTGRLDVRVALVPVPSRRAVVRRRGHDPLLRVTRRAAAVLRRHEVSVAVHPVLRPARRLRDQAALSAAERAANLHGAFEVRRPGPACEAVVVDDVITTGATAREAQRALGSAGLRVLGVAAVCATTRRGGPDRHERSLPLLGSGD